MGRRPGAARPETGRQGLNSQEADGLIAGFDAGQTHTSCRLAMADGSPVAEGEGPGVCHLAAADGPERFQEALRQSFAAACRQIGDQKQRDRLEPVKSGDSEGDTTRPDPQLLAAAVGASGIEQGSDVQELGLTLAGAALGLPRSQLAVTGDERTALRGAFPQGPGIIVISGTGTIAVGRDGQGRDHRCAGWGWLLDGAGSAMDIGREGLSLSLQMADGRLDDTPLRAALWQALAVDPADPQAAQRIKALVVRPEFGAAGFARLAPAVAQSACSGDPQAQAILRQNGAALAASVAGVARALGLEAPPVAALGGAITHLQGLQKAFTEALSQELPGARLQEPAGDAC
ncbi:MAG: BadF/BadG/BcrA/BcrD ATPase family protein, partial [Synechococcaceae cyanobacterium ELA739]